MLILILISAGLVGLAVVLAIGQASASGVRVAPVAPAADQRGITLQTLIVTAVLVLMAVAAGVVIVAITNNAAEDLEQTAPNLEGTCNEVEVYDPLLAARRERGIQLLGETLAGLNGSAVGCVPVCFGEVSGKVSRVFTDRQTLVEIQPIDRIYPQAASAKTAQDNTGSLAPDAAFDITDLFGDAYYKIKEDAADARLQTPDMRAKGGDFKSVSSDFSNTVRDDPASSRCILEYSNGVEEDSPGSTYDFIRLRG